MVRVPSTISSAMLGGRLPEQDEPLPELHRMSDAEAARFIQRCASALRSHERDYRVGPDKENALSAFEATMALLLEVRDVYPSKRADIDIVLVRHGYPITNN